MLLMPTKKKSTKKQSILVVDDDVRILRMTHRILEMEGYQVFNAINSNTALNLLYEEDLDLVLLDIMMPSMDGYAACRCIREFSEIPIIMLSAKNNAEDKVQALDVGADDYVTKPFSAGELVARIKAVLRRSSIEGQNTGPVFCCRELVIDFNRKRATLTNQELNLTATEYRLLSYLAHNAGCVVTPDLIVQKVWGEEYLGDAHLLQVNMARLRHKLGDNAKSSRYIITRPGIGYMLVK